MPCRENVMPCVSAANLLPTIVASEPLKSNKYALASKRSYWQTHTQNVIGLPKSFRSSEMLASSFIYDSVRSSIHLIPSIAHLASIKGENIFANIVCSIIDFADTNKNEIPFVSQCKNHIYLFFEKSAMFAIFNSIWGVHRIVESIECLNVSRMWTGGRPFSFCHVNLIQRKQQHARTNP